MATEYQPPSYNEATRQHASVGGDFTFVDFIPGVTETGFFSTEHERFSVLIDRANAWLVSQPTLEVKTCESVEFKARDGIPNTNKMSYFEHEKYSIRYIRGLRLWLVPRTDPSRPCQKLGYLNLVPNAKDSQSIFSYSNYETLNELLERFNKTAAATLPGRILAIESQEMKVPMSSNFDPDRSSWQESGQSTTRFLFVIRIFFEFGGNAEEIGVADFVPVMLEEGGMFALPRFEPFSYVISRASQWCEQQQSLRFCNAQSLEIKIKSANTQDAENHCNDETSIDKALLEKLIVDVIYEDLQDLHDQPEEDIHNESNDPEMLSAEPENQENLNTEQYSEHEELELTPAQNVITPELSPQNSLPSSSYSSPPSSPSLKSKPLPATPSLSEQESTSEELLQQSDPVEFKKAIASVTMPDLTPPQNCSPKHHVTTPPLSPQPANVSESVSHDEGIKKSVQDASVQVTKVSSSGDSTLGTIATTSISDTTDEFLSDGELLLKHAGQPFLPAQFDRGQKKSTVTIQNHPVEKITSQISKSSLSEGELPLLKAQKNALNVEHQLPTMDSNVEDTHFPIPTNSTFEQIWEDISEGQIIPRHTKENLKPFHLDRVSEKKETLYYRQFSQTLSEGEISASHVETPYFKSPTDAKQDDVSHHISSRNHNSNNNLSLSSGEIEDDEKLSKSLVENEEENVPEVTDAEFFEDKETVREQD